jgi:hypothetical protein
MGVIASGLVLLRMCDPERFAIFALTFSSRAFS